MTRIWYVKNLWRHPILNRTLLLLINPNLFKLRLTMLKVAMSNQLNRTTKLHLNLKQKVKLQSKQKLLSRLITKKL